MSSTVSSTIWSIPTRIMHWGVAFPVLIDYVVDGGDDLHNNAGYVALAVTGVRLVWGLVSKDKAHFKYFPLSPNSCISHTKAFFTGKKLDYPGHNPYASWTYLGIWSLVIGLGYTGYLMGTDEYWGDEGMETLHTQMAYALLFLIGMHLLGIIIDMVKFRRNTIAGMVSGKR